MKKSSRALMSSAACQVRCWKPEHLDRMWVRRVPVLPRSLVDSYHRTVHVVVTGRWKCVDSFFFCAYLCEPVGEFHGTDGSLQSPRLTEDPIKYAWRRFVRQSNKGGMRGNACIPICCYVNEKRYFLILLIYLLFFFNLLSVFWLCAQHTQRRI